MKTLSDNLTFFFNNAEKLHLIHSADSKKFTTEYKVKNDLVTYLNPIHPYPVHIVSSHELAYFKTLSDNEFKKLIDQLSQNNAQYLIFEELDDIPNIFFTQNHINLIISDYACNNLQIQLSREINELVAKQLSQHGVFVVVHNQGILITGKSGTGKS